jgi:hypothetical protein
MPASTIATSVRGAIKTAIANVAANTYDSVPEAPIVPFAAVVPANPYLEANLIGTSTRVRVNLVITVGVAMHSNAAALDNIEQLVMSILAVIPSGYTVGSVSNPVPLTIGASEILACEIELSTQYTQTN